MRHHRSVEMWIITPLACVCVCMRQRPCAYECVRVPGPVWTWQAWSIFGIDGCVTVHFYLWGSHTVPTTNFGCECNCTNICTKNLQNVSSPGLWRRLKWHLQRGICYSARHNKQNPIKGVDFPVQSDDGPLMLLTPLQHPPPCMRLLSSMIISR